METWKSGITLNGRKYSYKELLTLCSDRITSSDTNNWEKEIFRFIITWLSDADHIVQFSSGTTGKPREIKLAKSSMIQSARNTCSFFNLHEGNAALLCMPVDYIAGKMMIVRSMVCQLDLYITDPRSKPDIHVAPVIDFCAMVPLQVINLLACLNNLMPVRKLLIGGSGIGNELVTLLHPLTTEAFASYGMAESSSNVAIRRLNGQQPQHDYHALNGVKLSSDQRGCLVIDASWLPERIVTNDLVEFTSTDSFVWLGRYDNLINSGGIKIVPEEVEALVMEKMGLECVVTGLPDQILGQRLAFVFESAQMPKPADELKTELINILPRRWKPKDIIAIEKFPRNDSFKIIRMKIIEMITTH